jgi:hypothetical protein
VNPISRIAPVTDAEAAQMVAPGTLADLAERLTSKPAEAAAAEDAAGSAAWPSPRRRRLLLAIPAAAALAVTALLVTSLGVVTFSPGSRVTGSGPAPAGPARHTGGVPNPVGWNGNLYPLGPPGWAEKTTVAGAQAKVGYPVPVPSTPAASRANLTQVWVAPQNNRQVALVFDKGKVDILMQPSTYQFVLYYFHAFVAQKKKNGITVAPNGATVAIGQVNGRPALVKPPDTNGPYHNHASIDFWRNGVLISIFSNTKAYGTHTVLAIAESMR